MRLDKYNNFQKNHKSRVFEKIKKNPVNVIFRCSDFNQKLAVLLAYIELKFRIS